MWLNHVSIKITIKNDIKIKKQLYLISIVSNENIVITRGQDIQHPDL